MNIEISQLSTNDGIDIYNMLQNLVPNENGFRNSANGISYAQYQEWLIDNDKNAKQVGIVDEWKVPQTTYWLRVDGVPIGYGKIRHNMTDRLLKDGGNIGYSIIPSYRNQGFGKKFLSLLLQESCKLGVEKVLLTIHKDNIASKQIAIANNGIIEKTSEELYYIWIYPSK